MTPTRPRIPVIFLIDVEPDLHFVDRRARAPWLGYEKAFEYLARMRPRIEKVTGTIANYSWGYRMDPQIKDAYGRADWAVTHYADFFREITARNDALGLHVHGYRWDDGRGEWLVDHGSGEWMETCVRLAADTFKSAAGRPCDFLRFGERWMSDRAMALLEELGVPFDLTLEPGFEEVASYHPEKPFTGSVPDQRGIPNHPYRPSRGDFRLPDPFKKTGTWEIPLTTASIKPRLKFWWKPTLISANLYQDASKIVRALDTALKEKRGYLSILVRPDVFLRKNNPQNMDAVFDGLLRHRQASRLAFVSPAKALKLYKEGT